MERICSEEDCEEPVHCRKLCYNHYRRLWRQEIRQPGYASRRPPRHRLTQINQVAKTATCSVCGAGTEIKFKRKPAGWRCRTVVRAERKTYRQGINGRQAHQRQNRALRYQLTEQQYAAMVRQHQGRCRLCRRRENKLRIDHCHKTGRVRGLLCHDCNVGLGWFRDNPEVLRRAARYIEKVPAPSEEEAGTLF